jgi:hypothetical protein
LQRKFEKRGEHKMRRESIVLTAVLVLVLFCCTTLTAKPTTAYQAEKAVKGWLRADAHPLDTALGQHVTNVETFTNDSGEPIYYIVYLQPSGFVIVPADDLVEPIIGFVEQGIFDPSLDNPLGALVTNDLNGRVAAVRDIQNLEASGAMETALESQTKWEQLESFAEGFGIMGLGSISDVRVAPLIKSKWDQRDACGAWCYNYYVNQDILAGGYAGCVATAMAQLMRYHEHPTSGIGVHTFTIYVNGSPQDANTRGGDGNGGSYSWSDMVLEPNCANYTPTRWQAIGALCYDAGVTVNMNYKSIESTTDTRKAKDAFIGTFGYGNAIKGYNSGSEIGAGLTNMINPNLDGKDPVLLGITGPSGGHAVVCDGYGYNSGTMYHHLNMGWGGDDDAWYDLPTINSSPSYNVVYKCVYNVHVSGAGDGEMISGRVFDPNGDPIEGANVWAEPNGVPAWLGAQSDSKGIYAFDDLDSATNYTVNAQVQGYAFTSQSVTTGTSTDNNPTSGNVWGIDFHGQPLTITSITPTSGPRGSYIKIEGQNFGASPGEVGCVLFPGGPGNGEEVQWSDTVVYCRVPDDATSGDVKIQTADWCISSGKYFEVTSPNDVIVDPNNSTPNIQNGTAQYPFSTIQRGMRAATTGGSVTVKQGTYYEYIDFNGRSITLKSLDPQDPCIVAATIFDGNDGGPIVTFSSAEDANTILAGFTITDGNSSNGAIYCLGASPTINYCIIKNNTTPDNGGGMYNSWADSNGSYPTLNYCTFIDNTASSRGGAISNYESSPTLRDCLFINNSSTYGGGAIANWFNSNTTAINCLFLSNSASDQFSDGGAIYNGNGAYPKIFNCEFAGNSAVYRGGAMYSFLPNSSLVIVNSTFTGNTASSGGGAIYNDCGGPKFTNCTFSENEGGTHGDAIYNIFNNLYNQTTLTNCILWNNGSEEMYDNLSTTVVTYSDIKGGWTGATNIDRDPNFTRDPNDGGDGWGTGGNDDYGDLHLTPGSLCIDAGDNNAVPADTVDLDGDSNTAEPIPWDFDGHPRFVDDPCTTDTGSGTPPIVDMGADEFPYLGDLNFSGCVNFEDFAIFAPRWRDTGCGTCGGADLTGDANVDYDDLRQLALNWLAGCEP